MAYSLYLIRNTRDTDLKQITIIAAIVMISRMLNFFFALGTDFSILNDPPVKI